MYTQVHSDRKQWMPTSPYNMTSLKFILITWYSLNGFPVQDPETGRKT